MMRCDLTYLLLVLAQLACAPSISAYSPVFDALEFALTNRAPCSNCHTFGTTHREKIALKVTGQGGKSALVDYLLMVSSTYDSKRKLTYELSHTMIPGVLICLGNHPSWGVGDTKIKH
jgi:hypothetical protein